MKQICRTVLLLLAFAMPICAQQPTKIEESVHVTLIEVPVTVADRAGNPVRGLTAENFELIDDGMKRSITYFESIDLGQLPVSGSDEPRLHPAARRKFMLVFDLSGSIPGNLKRARDAAKVFVSEQLDKRDLVSVAAFVVENGFQLLSNFSTDRELAMRAIDSLANPRFFRHLDSLALSTVRPAGAERPAAETARGGNVHDLPVLNDLGEGGGYGGEVVKLLEEYDRLAQQSDDAFLRGRLRSQMKNFGGLATALDSVPGRKQMILLSEGFDSSLLQGRESGASADEMDAVVSGEIWKVDSEGRYGSAATVVDVLEMASLFQRSDVVLHAVDIAGLRSPIDARQGRSSKATRTNEGLFLITNPTGGEVFKNENELATNFRRMLKQQEVIYVLGFQVPAVERRGEFHNLQVRLRNAPRGARASHRSGYYDRADDQTPLGEKLRMSSILMDDIERGEVAFEMIAASFPTDRSPLLSCVIEIPASSLLENATGDTISAELLVYAFTREGKVADFLHEKISFDLVKVRAALEKRGVKYYGSLSLPPGDYVLKTLIRVSETGREGFQRMDVHVPALADAPIVSPFMLEEASEWIIVRSQRRTTEIP